LDKPGTDPDTQSLFSQGENCCAVARAERAAFVVDGDAYFSAFRRAAEAAERSISLVAWDFDSNTVLDPGKPNAVKLGDFLNDLARRKRKLHVHILDWDYPVVFGTDREMSPAVGLSSWKPHRRVHFRYDNTHPVAGSQHQKIAVFDDKIAFAGGLDLACKRWDTPGHSPDNPHRVAGGKPYPPFHDMMILVDGEAAGVLSKIVRGRWERATGDTLPAVFTAGDPWPADVRPDVANVRVGITCTEPEVTGRPGVRHVEKLYLDMIARARRYIYIENQYFTSHLVGKALAKRLAEPDGPEIVLVTRLLSHGWLEEMTMHVLRTRLIRALREVDRHGRFQVYYPHVEGLTEGTCIDVHSKMMAVDDEWLRIGSSNISNRSMGLDVECDVVLEARGEERVAGVIHAFRDRLLAEHLGVPATEVKQAIDASGSMIAAIATLGSPQRGLRALEELKEWPEPLVEAIAITDPERPVSLERLWGELSGAPGKPPSVFPKVLAFAALLAALMAAWRFTPLAGWISIDRVTAWAEDLGGRWWAPIVVVLAYTPASLLLIPRPLITLAATIAFGAWLAFVYGMLGILLAGAATFALGRMLERRTVERIAGKRLSRISEVLRRHGLPAVIAVRFLPVAPFWVVNMVAGAIRIKFWHFMVGTTIGILPGVLAATVFGDQFSDALKDPAGIDYWLLAGIAVFFGLVFLVVRRWVSRLHRASAGRAQAAAEPSPEPSRRSSEAAHSATEPRPERYANVT
jgi:phospholipase D1/2